MQLTEDVNNVRVDEKGNRWIKAPSPSGQDASVWIRESFSDTDLAEMTTGMGVGIRYGRAE